MNKSSESLTSAGRIDEGNLNEAERGELMSNPELTRPLITRLECNGSSGAMANQGEEKKEVPKFTMIFNKYSDKMNVRPNGKSQDDKNSEKFGSNKYTMIFNKDVTVRQKIDSLQMSFSTTDLKTDRGFTVEEGKSTKSALEPELSSAKLNDAETLMNLYGRSNLFIPELTVSSLLSESDENSKYRKQLKLLSDKRNDTALKFHNSLTSLPKNKLTRKSDNIIKNKIASMTSLETHLAREAPRKHVSAMQERKLFRVRSLDLSDSVSSSDSDLDRTFYFHKTGNVTDQSYKDGESPRKSDKKSRGDSARKGDKENGCRKQVQWKSEVDVIYFESHQAADGDRSGEILGRVMEPLREEWEQQRTGFYAKLVPLPLGNHLNERWQSLLKI